MTVPKPVCRMIQRVPGFTALLPAVTGVQPRVADLVTNELGATGLW
jgi:hypothetical protein